MRIKKMTASFGALDGRTLELGGGLNIIYAPNESGKSTWCAFLRTMLYGMDTSQRAKAGQKPDKVKYLPWSGAPMAGSVDLETETHGAVTLRRWTERAGQPMQAFSATVTGTETPVPGLTSDNAGEVLTGMSRDVFDRSVFVRQSGLELTNDPELDRRISAIVSSGDEDVSYMEAEERLKSWQRHRSGRTGALAAADAEIADAESALASIRGDVAAVSEADAALEALEGRKADAERRMHEARARQRKQALQALADVRKSVQAAEDASASAKAALDGVEDGLKATPYGMMGAEEAARRSELDARNAVELKRIADRLPPVSIAYFPLAIAVLTFILALVSPWKIPCAGVGCIATLLFVVMYTRLLAIRKTKEETLSQRQRILDAYGVEEPEDIPALLEEYRKLWRARERAAARREIADEELDAAKTAQREAETQAVGALDFVNGDNEAARAGREVEELDRQIAALKLSRAEAEGHARATGDPMALESGLSEARERRERLAEQDDALGLALSVLKDADTELQQRVSPLLAQRAQELFARLTGGRYDEVTLTRGLDARTRPAGDAVGRETDYLSAGAKDQLYLALRLAVCELALADGEPCPIVLDDAFVNFDQERLGRALELMRGIAEERQVLLLTCQERELAYFADDDAVTKLRVGRGEDDA